MKGLVKQVINFQIKSFIYTVVLIFFASILLNCSIETASGPTPYVVFSGTTYSTTTETIGKGVKTFIIPKGLVMNGIGKIMTISPIENSSMYMKGVVTSYDRGSGKLVVDVNEISGSGTFNKWSMILGKSLEEILDSVKQAYVNLKFGMFLHFNMSTFDRCCCERCYSVAGEWGLANRDPKFFNPTRLECGQWADVAKDAGCKYMILVVKHHDGFCLWPTKYTSYCVTNASCTTDVVRQFVDSARTRGMRVGFYYSIRDLTNGHDLSFIKGQLTELLTNYGDDILCIWFDGWGWDVGYKKVPYDTIRNLIRSIQPYCLIIENNHEFTTLHSDLLEWEIPIDGPPPLNNTKPAEGNEPIRYSTATKERCWFWHPIGNCDLMPTEMIVDRIKSCNKANAAYLLDLTPDTTGLIPECQAERMKEVGKTLGVNW